jgi:hypothetical protein
MPHSSNTETFKNTRTTLNPSFAGLWGNLASLSGLGPDDPGSNRPEQKTRGTKVRAAPLYHDGKNSN